MTGRVFEIREFCLHDGPGIRTTVFLKGCPLVCAWCQNPEGQSFAVEELRAADGTSRTCGTDYEPAVLVRELLANADILRSSGGGITFSGGEPLAQADFVLAVTEELHRAGVAVALETSGAAPAAVYRRVVGRMDFVYQDLKLPTAEGYARWCGGRGEQIFANIAWLKASGIAYALRIPVIPGVNDDAATQAALARAVGESPVEHLPYNPAAGAKYKLLGRAYSDDFNRGQDV